VSSRKRLQESVVRLHPVLTSVRKDVKAGKRKKPKKSFSRILRKQFTFIFRSIEIGRIHFNTFLTFFMTSLILVPCTLCYYYYCFEILQCLLFRLEEKLIQDISKYYSVRRLIGSLWANPIVITIIE